MKTCPTCKELKMESEFHKDKNRKDGLKCCCIKCRRKERTGYDVVKPRGVHRKENSRQSQIRKYGIDLVETLESLHDVDY